MFDSVNQGEEEAVQFYNQWVEEVKRVVPKERLLIHQAKEGWEPLCNFLGLPIPDNPYPRVNDTAQVASTMRKIKIISYVVIVGFPLIASAVAGYFCKDSIASYIG